MIGSSSCISGWLADTCNGVATHLLTPRDHPLLVPALAFHRLLRCGVRSQLALSGLIHPPCFLLFPPALRFPALLCLSLCLFALSLLPFLLLALETRLLHLSGTDSLQAGQQLLLFVIFGGGAAY